jgi:hypothetical protein
VLELRGGAGLAREAGHRLGVLDVLGADDLDGHRAAERAVAGEVDDGHAAAPQLADEVIVVLEFPDLRRDFPVARHVASLLPSELVQPAGPAQPRRPVQRVVRGNVPRGECPRHRGLPATPMLPALPVNVP